MSLRSNWKPVIVGTFIMIFSINAKADQLAIVVDPKASEVERFASEELRHYLKKITGQEVAIGAQVPESVPAFLVGDLAAAEKQDLGEEGYVLCSTDQGLVLAGGERRGTLYAVYDFLERLGCRWYFPDPEDEIVPQLSIDEVVKVMRSGLQVTEKPDFSVRMYRFLNYMVGPSGTTTSDTIMKKSVPNTIDWLTKNRMNIFLHGLDFHQACLDRFHQLRNLLPEMRKRGLVLGVGGHCVFVFMPLEEFKKHPDWIAQVEGKSNIADKAMFCTRNEEAVRYYLDNLVSFIKQNPEIEYFAPWPKDLTIWCECPRCKDASITDRYMELGKRIYMELKKKTPHVRVTHFAYDTHIAPPENESLLPGMTMTLCTHSRDLAVPFADDRTSKQYRGYFDGWREMTRAAGCSFIFHGKYARMWGLGGFHPLPLPILQKDCQWFRQNGLDGFELPIGHMGWRTKSFNLHVLAKLMWNADADVEAIIDDYFSRCYGGCDHAMRQVYKEVELAQPMLQYWRGNPIRKELHRLPAGQKYTDQIKEYACNTIMHLRQAEQYIQQAMSQAHNEAVRGRIKRFAQSLKYLFIEWKALTHLIEGAEHVAQADLAADKTIRTKELNAAEAEIKLAKELSDQRTNMAKEIHNWGLYWDVVAGTPASIFRERQINDWLKLIADKQTNNQNKSK